MRSIERAGLVSDAQISEAHHLAWEKHREVCKEPGLYKTRQRSEGAYLITHYACPNCRFTETIWKNRRRGDAAVTDSLKFCYEPHDVAL